MLSRVELAATGTAAISCPTAFEPTGGSAEGVCTPESCEWTADKTPPPLPARDEGQLPVWFVPLAASCPDPLRVEEAGIPTLIAEDEERTVSETRPEAAFPDAALPADVTARKPELSIPAETRRVTPEATESLGECAVAGADSLSIEDD